MTELLIALTEFLKEATVWLGRQNGKASPTVHVGPAPVLDAPAARRTRKTKENADIASVPPATPVSPVVAPMPEGLDTPPAAAPTTTVPVAASSEEIPEGKSLAALYEVGAKVVERFKNSKPSGFERATAHMTTTYKVARMQDLPHAQRLQFIGWLKTELEKPA